jgi:hypothetical protein
MTLKELIRLLEIADSSTQVSNGFKLAYTIRTFGGIAFFPAENTTIGSMLKLAKDCIDHGIAEDVNVWIAPLRETGEEITLSMVLDWIQGKSMPLPKKIELIENPDLDALQELLKEYADVVKGDDYYSDNDYKYVIYEKVIDTFLGDDFWKVLNRKD